LPPSPDTDQPTSPPDHTTSGLEDRSHSVLRRIGHLLALSIDPRKIVLAAAGILMLAAGDWVIHKLPFATPQSEANLRHTFHFVESEKYPAQPWRWIASYRAPLQSDLTSWTRALGPLDPLIQPIQIMFHPRADWTTLGLAWTRFLWALAVWSFFGGAITRIAAVQLASGRNISLKQAVSFARARFLSNFTAPLIPLAGIGLCWGLCRLLGLTALIPTAGPWIVGLLWGVMLILGILITVQIVGLAIGWPLIIATVSYEGSDFSDGLTRSYAYSLGQPHVYSLMTGVVIVIGAILIFLAARFSELALLMAGEAVGGSDSSALLQNPLTLFWTILWADLVAGFAHSYFWSGATVLYALLRREADGIQLNEVYLKPDDLSDVELWGEVEEAPDYSE